MSRVLIRLAIRLEIQALVFFMNNGSIQKLQALEFGLKVIRIGLGDR